MALFLAKSRLARLTFIQYRPRQPLRRIEAALYTRALVPRQVSPMSTAFLLDRRIVAVGFKPAPLSRTLFRVSGSCAENPCASLMGKALGRGNARILSGNDRGHLNLASKAGGRPPAIAGQVRAQLLEFTAPLRAKEGEPI